MFHFLEDFRQVRASYNPIEFVIPDDVLGDYGPRVPEARLYCLNVGHVVKSIVNFAGAVAMGYVASAP